MEGQNYLGIYLSKDTATVVCLAPADNEQRVLGCFSVSAEETEGQNPQMLATLIAQGCAERELKFSEVAVALDCAMFMQHNMHSEFRDLKQIAATIKFDTEEALATDVADIAIAFKITSSDQSGSELTVFTAQRKILSDVLLPLQSNNIDPATIEPDVNCVSRFICQNVSLPESQQVGTLFVMLSRRSAYFIVPHLRTGAGAQKTFQTSPTVMRTFLLGPTQDRNGLLAREVPVTTALVGTGEPINRLKVFDSTGSINVQTLSEKLGIEADEVDWLQSVTTDPQVLADCADTVDFAIAYGAALAHLEKAQSVNFRNDFSPFQGRKVRLQKALKFASCSVTVFVLAVGMYFQSQLLQRNKYRSQLRDKFGKQYSAVMFGKKPPAKSNPVNKLAGELRRIRSKSGQSNIAGEESISAKLTLVLEAFNKCAAATNLKIDLISITDKTISIVGSTSNRKNTLKVFETIKGKLEILQQRLDSKAGRDIFRITVVPKK